MSRKSIIIRVAACIIVMTLGFYFFDKNWIDAVLKGVVIGGIISYGNIKYINNKNT